MSQTLLNHLAFVRQVTITAAQGLSDLALDYIPEGFNNNIRWNLGHIYVIQEKFAFLFAGEPLQLPDHFDRWFSKGTKPADWQEEQLPTLDELLKLLAEQPVRIKKELQHRLDEQVKAPFTTGNGLALSTIEEFLSYTLFHEGIHFNAINTLKRFADKSL
jgi:uncharacterized damage-inducible protein DinB